MRCSMMGRREQKRAVVVVVEVVDWFRQRVEFPAWKLTEWQRRRMHPNMLPPTLDSIKC